MVEVESSGGLDGRGLAEIFQGLLRLPGRQVDDCARIQELRFRPVQFDGPVDQLPGLAWPAAAQGELIGQVVQRLDVLGGLGENAAVKPFDLVVSALEVAESRQRQQQCLLGPLP